MSLFTRCLAPAALAACATAASAVEVRITVTGVVDYNVIQGAMGPVPDGAPVSMSFSVDSNNFLGSAQFPTRGYAINPASFVMSVGGVAVTMDNPQPNGPAYFVLRDNDPGVDGFFISQGSVELPFPATVRIPGLAAAHELDFSRTFTTTTTLSSLNILDAVGSYGFENMSSYLWTIGRFGNPGAEYVYETISIAVVPEPAALGLMALGTLLVLRRARDGHGVPKT